MNSPLLFQEKIGKEFKGPQPPRRAALLVIGYWLYVIRKNREYTLSSLLYLCLFTRKRRRRGSFSGLISQKIPQEDAVAADRAFFPGALSA